MTSRSPFCLTGFPLRSGSHLVNIHPTLLFICSAPLFPVAAVLQRSLLMAGSREHQASPLSTGELFPIFDLRRQHDANIR